MLTWVIAAGAAGVITMLAVLILRSQRERRVAERELADAVEAWLRDREAAR